MPQKVKKLVAILATSISIIERKTIISSSYMTDHIINLT